MHGQVFQIHDVSRLRTTNTSSVIHEYSYTYMLTEKTTTYVHGEIKKMVYLCVFVLFSNGSSCAPCTSKKTQTCTYPTIRSVFFLPE